MTGAPLHSSPAFRNSAPVVAFAQRETTQANNSNFVEYLSLTETLKPGWYMVVWDAVVQPISIIGFLASIAPYQLELRKDGQKLGEGVNVMLETSAVDLFPGGWEGRHDHGLPVTFQVTSEAAVNFQLMWRTQNIANAVVGLLDAEMVFGHIAILKSEPPEGA